MTKRDLYYRYISFIFLLFSFCETSIAQTTLPTTASKDSLYNLGEVIISASPLRKERQTTIPATFADSYFLRKNISDSFTATLAKVPGVRSMSIGNGFGKPIIRGFGFNRVAYIEGGMKQIGQAWGADHGLEVDNFEDLPVEIVKGPRSLLYGSEALGGAIVTALPHMPLNSGLSGSVTLLGTGVNGGIGGSLLLSYRFSNSFLRVRYSEQHFGDKNVMADTIRYLDRNIPVAKRRMKNTAGYNRAFKSSFLWKNGRHSGLIQYSDLFQKAGFFPGAHGIPDLRRLTDDGNRYNVELPYSTVRSQKLQIRENYSDGMDWSGHISLAYQRNLRREWSLFHTHYPSQPLPEKDPSKEIEMDLHSLSARTEVSYYGIEKLKLQGVIDGGIRWQHIAGYGFLIPPYKFSNIGSGIIAIYTPHKEWQIEGGLRYDFGKINAQESRDPYLASFLEKNGHNAKDIEENSIRSYAIHRHFSSLSGSISFAYHPTNEHTLKLALCRGFRFPEINELTINGVHHGSFRHDRGDSSLSPERSVQLSLGYLFNLEERFELCLELFGNYFDNFIYGTPTGLWSPLPHAGQIFQYRQNRAIIGGGELQAKYHLPIGIYIEGSSEYIISKNLDRGIPLPYTPPARMRVIFGYKHKSLDANICYRYIAKANRIVPGEEITPSAQLIDFTINYAFKLMGIHPELTFSIENLFNRTYYDHLAFYRKIGLPEAGRNTKINLRIPF